MARRRTRPESLNAGNRWWGVRNSMSVRGGRRLKQPTAGNDRIGLLILSHIAGLQSHVGRLQNLLRCLVLRERHDRQIIRIDRVLLLAEFPSARGFGFKVVEM